MENKIKIIYILGSGHCGSTLLDLLLDSHSQITGVGEIENIRRELCHKCTCNQPFYKCKFWKDIFDFDNLKRISVGRNKINFLLNRQKYYIFKTEKRRKISDNNKYIKLNENIYKKIVNKTGARVIIDSSKYVDRAELLMQSKELDIIILHLIRDGRAVTWSYIKLFNKALPYIIKWVITNIKTEILKLRNQAKIINLKYEVLVNNPEESLKKICGMADLKFEKNMMNFRNPEHHQIGGNIIRFYKNEKILEDKEWVRKMPFRYKALFNIIGGWLNIIYKIKYRNFQRK